ncbi:MAG: thiamine-phosphate kinase [Campylobacterota bacterium]|nr:thiamine-phosphate kinase [Campylobacterota bacterium]
MNAEDYFISLFSKSTALIGDDGAITGALVYSKDAFFENVHFKRDWMSLEQIAYRAMMVNISDAVAMNAKPLYALLAVAMPSSFKSVQMRQLSAGFHRAALEYGVEIIGGDTISNCKLDITVTIVSTTSKPLRRRGLKEGDLLAHTGRLGRSGKELRYLLAGRRVHASSKFISFSLRDTFVADSTGALTCGMDISDGLFSDLQKLSRANGLGYRFFESIAKREGCSGEEYEMLIGFSQRKRKKMIRLAQKNRTPLTIFAQARRGKFTNRCKAHHF